MAEINNTLLQRVATGALINVLANRAGGVTAAGTNRALPGPTAGIRLDSEQASSALRQAVLSWLRGATTPAPTDAPRPTPARADAVPSPTASGQTPAYVALRELVGDIARMLVATTTGAHNRQVIEQARTALLKELELRMQATADTRGNRDGDEARPRTVNTDNGWPLFAWLNQATTPRGLRAGRSRVGRRRDDDDNDTQDDRGHNGEGNGKGNGGGRDDAALMDIVAWLQRQPSDGDYGALLRGDTQSRRTGQVFNESV